MATYERQGAAVLALARHLRAGGLAIVDVVVLDADELAAYDARLVLEWMRPDEDGLHEGRRSAAPAGHARPAR